MTFPVCRVTMATQPAELKALNLGSNVEEGHGTSVLRINPGYTLNNPISIQPHAAAGSEIRCSFRTRIFLAHGSKSIHASDEGGAKERKLEPPVGGHQRRCPSWHQKTRNQILLTSQLGSGGPPPWPGQMLTLYSVTAVTVLYSGN